MAEWKTNRLEEKLRNSDYPKFIKLFNSENPRYYFACISADRGAGNTEGLSKKEVDDANARNNRNSLDLEHQLNFNGFRYIEITGHYDEVDDEEGKVIPVIERSFIVYSIYKDKLKNVIMELGKLYEQDSILFIDEDRKGEIIWLNPKKEQPEILKGKKSLNFNQASNVLDYSLIGTRKHARRFQLDSIEESCFNRNFISMLGYSGSNHWFDYRKRFQEGYDNYIKNFEKEFKEWLKGK